MLLKSVKLWDTSTRTILELLKLSAVQKWLDAYRRAWETYEPAAVATLFSDDAEYRWHPWDEGSNVARGQEAITAAWLENRDAPGTYSGDYRPLLVHDQTAIAVGTSRYYSDSTQQVVAREFCNLWVLEFDEAGRCQSFTEWFMKKPARQ